MMRLLRRIAFLVRRRDDVAEEIELHRQMKADELRAKGMPEEQIRAATQRALGNDMSAREQSHDVWVPLWLQDVSQDLKFGARMLIKDRRFTVAAVLALGLGIGLNNSVFTFVKAAMFKELPFPNPERLVDVRLNDTRGMGSVSPADFLEWQATATCFEGLGAAAGTTLNVSDEQAGADRLRGAFLSANTGQLLRVRPVAGRDFLPSDAEPGAPAVLLISHEVWQSRYGGEPVIGRAVRVNGQPSTIVGIMPPRFAFPMMAQAWVPLTMVQLRAAPRDRRSLGVFGRLKHERSLMDAQAEMATIASRIAAEHPNNQPLTLSITTLGDGRPAKRDSAIYATLLGAVGFVLLVACANVASLLLARATDRSREMAVRASLGAPRWRLIRQLMVECSLIAILAGVVGYWLSLFGANEIAQAFGIYEVGAPGGTVMPYWVDLSTDSYTVLFVGVACLVTSLAIGMAPAWHVAGTNVNEAPKEGGRTGTSTARAHAMTGGLIVTQLALTVVLLSAAGLTLRSFATLYFTDLVIDTKNVVSMRVLLPVEKYPTFDHQRRFFEALDERLSANPRFASAALISDVPFMPLGFVLSGLSIQGQDIVPGVDLPQAFSVTVGPRLLEVLRVPLTQGRALTASDTQPGQEGVVINERFAGRFFPQGDAVGQRIRFTAANGRTGPWLTVVGVVRTLPSFVRAEETEPVAYVPLAVDARQPRSMSVLVRGVDPGAGPQALVAAVREHVAALDPNLPVFAVQTMDDAVRMGRNSARMFGVWFVTIAGIALVLAAVGLYALTAHGVAQRKREIGVRMALGARSSQVTWLFVRRSAIQLGLGLTIGTTGALMIGKLLSAFIRGTDPRDPLTIVVVGVLLMIVGFSASVLPARKAARIDPVSALRAD